jgi:hypothetical protein
VVLGWEFLQSPRAWRFNAALACWAAQVYLTVYIGYFLTVLLVVGAAVAAARFRSQLPWGELLRPGRREWRLRLLGLSASTLAVMLLLTQHGKGVGKVEHEFLRGVAPRPASWLTPPAIAGAFPELADWTRLGNGMPDAGEQQIGPGLIPLAAVALGLWCIVRPGKLGGAPSVAAVAAASATLIVLACTRFGDFWLYGAVTHLPGASSIRVIGRIVLVLLFPAAVVLAAGIDWAGRRARRAGMVAVVFVALAALTAVIADQWLARPDGPRAGGWGFMRYPLETARARQERLKEGIRARPDAKLLYAFPSLGDGPLGAMGLQLEAMRAAQDLGLPCVNGWSGYLPGGWDMFWTRRELFVWLTIHNSTDPDLLAGLVLLGDPVPREPHGGRGWPLDR